jgi:hypothetical protein
MTDLSLTPCRVASRPATTSPDTPETLAEHNLMRRILIAMPVGAAVFALLVAGAMVIARQPVVIPAAMGAGIGVLAGSFFGMWAGFVASVSELDEVDLHLDR